jgi:hypothetical protein
VDTALLDRPFVMESSDEERSLLALSHRENGNPMVVRMIAMDDSYPMFLNEFS